jgi:hypothetical protein
MVFLPETRRVLHETGCPQSTRCLRRPGEVAATTTTGAAASVIGETSTAGATVATVEAIVEVIEEAIEEAIEAEKWGF